MTQNISWRHHYIPRFYLKGFLSSSDKFHVFDKSSDQVLQFKSPRAYFFERDRNTFKNVDGVIDDFMESFMYKNLDDFTKESFELLQANKLSELTDNVKRLSKIIMFINGIFYRIPAYDDFHNQQIEAGNSDYFLPIKNKAGDDCSKEFYEKKKNDDLYKFACRFHIGLKGILPTPEEAKKWVIYRIPDSYEGKYNLLTSDSPVIIDDIKLFRSGKELIIFPLTKHHFIIRSNTELNQDMDAYEFLHFLNLAVTSNAAQYMSSPSKEVFDFYRQEYKKYDYSEIIENLIRLTK